MANFKRVGYGQVEPNHLSGIVTGQILAQLPIDNATVLKTGYPALENGRFLTYNYPANKVDLSGKGEWMLVYNEQKLYDERKQGLKDFAMVPSDYANKEVVPRLISILLGDILTTNCVGKPNTGTDVELDTGVEDDAAFMVVGEDGYLKKSEDGKDGQAGAPVFQVVKKATMPDGQAAFKLMCIPKPADA